MSRHNLFEISDLTPRAGAERTQIETVERELGCNLPEDYRTFLRTSNGLEGFVSSEAYLILWPVQEIIFLNTAYATAEFAPGLVLIGTNGGDTGYGIIVSQTKFQYVRVPLIGMSLDMIEPMGDTIVDLVK